MSNHIEEEHSDNKKAKHLFFRILSFLGLVFIFLVFHEMMTESIRHFSSETVKEIIIATTNPYIGLFIGLLSTAIIQSSSTTTSMIVAIVASGTLDLQSAIPMVMGANIGTTLTSTFVSLAHINKDKEFRRAIYVGTVHDFFNIFNTLLLLPLEYYFGFLSSASQTLASLFYIPDSNFEGVFNILDYTINPISNFLVFIFQDYHWLAFIVSFIGLFSTIKAFIALLRSSLIGERQTLIEKHVFGNKLKSLLWGAATTAGIHSSSVVTSLVVPVVTARKIGLKTIYPFILGANIGTTITALIAAISKSEAALSIAMAHFLFNIIGVTIFAPYLPTSNFPISIAKWMGRTIFRNKLAIFFYITIIFFILPFLLIFSTRSSINLKEYTFEIKNFKKDNAYKKVVLDEIRKTQKSKFYTSYNIFRDNEFKKDQRLSEKVKVLKYNGILFIGKNKYPLNQKNSCISIKNEQNNFKICLDSIITDFTLNKNIKSDSCYLYRKTYNKNYLYNKENIFLDIERMLVIKHEKYNKKGNLIWKKELMKEISR